MKLLFLEPFFGGSHRAFAQGLISHSKHTIDLVTLPDRFWKWRLGGAAFYFYKAIANLQVYDGLITTSLMRLSDFKALGGGVCPPTMVYFHESQLTYPQPSGKSLNFQLALSDIATGLTAERVLFNSQTHFNAFFSALKAFIKKMPDHPPDWVIDAIRSKSAVLYPGCNFPEGAPDQRAFADRTPPLIIWNHRWEFDKNPKAFFEALETLLKKGLDFEIALLGQNSQFVPKPFLKARKRFGKRIIQYGYVASKTKYHEWLQRGSIVVSTANQENFGMAVVEAIRWGCLPVLPNRLSYPEIIPEELYSDFLYRDKSELITKLAFILTNMGEFEAKRKQLSEAMARFEWKKMGMLYDQALMQLVSSNGKLMR